MIFLASFTLPATAASNSGVCLIPTLGLDHAGGNGAVGKRPACHPQRVRHKSPQLAPSEYPAKLAVAGTNGSRVAFVAKQLERLIHEGEIRSRRVFLLSQYVNFTGQLCPLSNQC